MSSAYRLMGHVTAGKCHLACGRHPEDKGASATHHAGTRAVATDGSSPIGIAVSTTTHSAASDEPLSGCLNKQNIDPKSHQQEASL